MEQFLEIILETEKEAANIEREASDSLSKIEREYTLALAKLEGQSLKEVYKRLQEEKQLHLHELAVLDEKISKEQKEQCALIESAGEKVAKAGIELVTDTLLSELD